AVLPPHVAALAFSLPCQRSTLSLSFLFFDDPAPTEIYTLSLHDALPIFEGFIGVEEAVEIRLFGQIADPLVLFHIVSRLSARRRSEEHTSELQSRENLVCRLLLEKKKQVKNNPPKKNRNDNHRQARNRIT